MAVHEDHVDRLAGEPADGSESREPGTDHDDSGSRLRHRDEANPGVSELRRVSRADATRGSQDRESPRRDPTPGPVWWCGGGGTAVSDTARSLDAGAMVQYRVPLVDTARRFQTGHRLRLVLASDDRRDGPSFAGFEHASCGGGARQRIASSSRLVLHVAAGAEALAPSR